MSQTNNTYFVGCPDIARHIKETHGIAINASSVHRAFKKLKTDSVPGRPVVIPFDMLPEIIKLMPRLRNRINSKEKSTEKTPKE
jgi:hypothetical protein